MGPWHRRTSSVSHVPPRARGSEEKYLREFNGVDRSLRRVEVEDPSTLMSCGTKSGETLVSFGKPRDVGECK